MSIKSSYTLTISLFAISTLSGAVLSSTVFATDSTTLQIIKAEVDRMANLRK